MIVLDLVKLSIDPVELADGLLVLLAVRDGEEALILGDSRFGKSDSLWLWFLCISYYLRNCFDSFV